MEQLIKVGLEDLAKCFDIKINLFEVFQKEILSNINLVAMMNARGKIEDWKEVTPLGGPGTILNAICLYCLVRYYRITNIVETGVSGGFYTGFLLEALNVTNRDRSSLVSLELSQDSTIGCLIPESVDKKAWTLVKGQNSLEHLAKVKYGALFQMFCHDSLHTMKHMTQELIEFKRCSQNHFLIFIDDQDSDLFWRRSLQTNAFNKPGYRVKYISGNESRLKGHLGGFIEFEKL